MTVHSMYPAVEVVVAVAGVPVVAGWFDQVTPFSVHEAAFWSA